MDNPQSFDIFIKRKIPFITVLLWWTILLFFGITFLFYIIMLPTAYASDEMSTAYYILAVPNFFKEISAYAFLGLIIVAPIYNWAYRYIPAILTGDKSSLKISSKKVDIRLETNQIEKIFVNDLHTLFKRPKNKIQVVIRQKNKKLATFILKKYQDIEQFIETFGNMENVEFVFLEYELSTTHKDE